MQQHDDFHDLLVRTLPRLRVRAAALTQHRAAAEDLVQDAVMNALSARDSFTAGTNFGAWMNRILYNRFVSTTRKRREMGQIDTLPEATLAVGAAQEHRLALSELRRAVLSLPREQRAALLMVALDGMSYEEVAAATACAVGTAKSRVFRARRHLQACLMGATNMQDAVSRPITSAAKGGSSKKQAALTATVG
jgi:RNA polymerase sigma-70 factor, ECF subfamily